MSLIIAPPGSGPGAPPKRWRAPALLAIGALHAAGHRGLAADLRSAAARGVHCATVALSTSSATTSSVGKRALIPLDAVVSQILAVLRDLSVDALKIGDLASPDGVDAVVEALQQAERDGHKNEKIVVDPSLVDKRGAQLLPDSLARRILDQSLLERAHVLTLNVFEAARLTGKPVGDKASIKDAARALFDIGVDFPLIHSPLDERYAVDLVFDGSGFVEFGSDRVRTAHLAGSGDVFSATLAAELAKGTHALEAIELTRRLVLAAIDRPLAVGAGERPINPLVELYEAADIDASSVEVEVDSAALGARRGERNSPP